MSRSNFLLIRPFFMTRIITFITLFIFHISDSLAYDNGSLYTLLRTSEDSICQSAKITLTRYRRIKGDSTIEEGIIVKGQLIESSVEIKEGEYIFGFGNQHTRVPRVSFYCVSNEPGKTFNGKRDEKKVGIWFGWYIWGGIRRVTMYEAGKIIRIIYFRPNGKIARVIHYKDGKPRKWGNFFYDKNGFVKNGTASW